MESTINRQRYLRPLWVCMALSAVGEFLIFIVFGVLLFPGGNLLHKFLWTTVFCGLGMGATLGALVDLWIVDCLSGISAVMGTVALSTGLLGIVCNLLCLHLDHSFHYFGGAENELLFFVNGLIMAAGGGALASGLLFTSRGQSLLNRIFREV